MCREYINGYWGVFKESKMAIWAKANCNRFLSFSEAVQTGRHPALDALIF